MLQAASVLGVVGGHGAGNRVGDFKRGCKPAASFVSKLVGGTQCQRRRVGSPSLKLPLANFLLAKHLRRDAAHLQAGVFGPFSLSCNACEIHYDGVCAEGYTLQDPGLVYGHQWGVLSAVLPTNTLFQTGRPR